MRDFAGRGGVVHARLARVGNERPNYGGYPPDAPIHGLAEAHGADELRVLAKRIPEPVKRRALQRPDAFLAFPACGDATLDKLTTKTSRKFGKKAGRTVS